MMRLSGQQKRQREGGEEKSRQTPILSCGRLRKIDVIAAIRSVAAWELIFRPRGLIFYPMESAEARSTDAALNRRSRPSRLTRLGRGVAAIAAVVVLFYTVAGYLGSADMFGDHPRWRGMNRGPADFGLRSETVAFDSKDGIPLKAWWLPASRTPRGAVIFAHGIDHTRQVMLPRAGFLVGAGYDVLLIDLRGHGESGGTIVSPGLLEARDILGALRYIRSRGNNDPVAVLGVSYGAVASLIAAAESPDIAAVIGDGAFPADRNIPGTGIAIRGSVGGPHQSSRAADIGRKGLDRANR
jgi:hypothetical protein